jgi:hypothetical protein
MPSASSFFFYHRIMGEPYEGLTTECSEPCCQSSIVAIAITAFRDV